jgi:hypothetical protein
MSQAGSFKTRNRRQTTGKRATHGEAAARFEASPSAMRLSMRAALEPMCRKRDLAARPGKHLEIK